MRAFVAGYAPACPPPSTSTSHSPFAGSSRPSSAFRCRFRVCVPGVPARD